MIWKMVKVFYIYQMVKNLMVILLLIVLKVQVYITH